MAAAKTSSIPLTRGRSRRRRRIRSPRRGKPGRKPSKAGRDLHETADSHARQDVLVIHAHDRAVVAAPTCEMKTDRIVAAAGGARERNEPGRDETLREVRVVKQLAEQFFRAWIGEQLELRKVSRLPSVVEHQVLVEGGEACAD